MNAMHFDGLSGAAYVSLVAFSIVFIVLLGLTLVIFAMRLFAAGERPKPDDGAPARERPQSAPAAFAIRAEDAQARVVAAITAAILTATGGAGRVVSIAPETVETAQKSARWTRAWRASGVLNLISRSVDRGWKR